ncbi:MAG TPA: bifunctional precorrin-2 dehydrogenase/sirohydrochlorin ferrochelatase [Acidobacteriaceae bacterium]|jgi:precorrin-2 dehydrogenase/sirohydrochlorin ferrochelatase|nr:bifunctional precorrin-2 dehydrogenase/sirohydrochlorin ferrochelatase [Acidobacteriaceae bacterium]
MPLFPIFLKLTGRHCLVVGAGNVAESKISSLLHAQAKLTVVAPEALPGIAQQASAGQFLWEQRVFAPEDLKDVFLVIAATSSPEVNQQVFLLASERGILCNAVDDPPNCDFYFPSIVERGALQIAISTAGESPALAQRLRKEIDGQLAPDLGGWLDQLGQLRRDILQEYEPSEGRKLLLHELASLPLCKLPACPARQRAHSAALDRTSNGKESIS